MPAAAKANLAALALLACALSAHLWTDWSNDPDLSHGLVMPAACAVLLFLARGEGPGRTLGPGAAGALAGTLGALGLASLWAAGLMAVSLDWTSPPVDFALATSLALLGSAAVAAFADRRSPWLAFGWPALAAALLWPLTSPPPPGTYQRLALRLQLWVSSGVMHTLEILGVAAHRDGNVIELARGTVGIEEACSGVRSLISCVFAGLLFSAALVRRPAARIAVVVLAAPLALLMNFLRSLLLTLLVNAGVRIEGAVHDATGYAVLVLTAALLFGLAAVLDRRSGPRPESRPVGAPQAGAAFPASQGILSGALVLTLATLVFFAAETRRAPAVPSPVPDLAALLPAQAPGWRVMTSRDLYQFQGTLRTDHLAQRSYVSADGRQVTIYVAYWSEGQASVGLVGSHTPDACWPGSGWSEEAVKDPSPSLAVGAHTLPPARHESFTSGAYPQHVWFWQLYGGRAIDVGNTKSVGALLRIALTFGVREGERQAFVRVSSNRPWEEVAREPFVGEFFERARILGLY
jgi:EpsI family protein